MAIVVRVSSEPEEDFLSLTPVTLVESITTDLLSGGSGMLLSPATNKY